MASDNDMGRRDDTKDRGGGGGSRKERAFYMRISEKLGGRNKLKRSRKERA